MCGYLTTDHSCSPPFMKCVGVFIKESMEITSSLSSAEQYFCSMMVLSSRSIIEWREPIIFAKIISLVIDKASQSWCSKLYVNNYCSVTCAICWYMYYLIDNWWALLMVHSKWYYSTRLNFIIKPCRISAWHKDYHMWPEGSVSAKFQCMYQIPFIYKFLAFLTRLFQYDYNCVPRYTCNHDI